MFILIEETKENEEYKVLGKHEELGVLIYAAKQYMNEAKRLKKDIEVLIETDNKSDSIYKLP